MTAEAWERIKTSFEAAAGLTGSARAGYLENLRRDDPVVHAAVVDLLSAHDEANGFLETFSIGHEWVFRTGELVDQRFRIVNRISRGGMGEVYEVFDEKLRERRALKTLRPQLAFDQEAVERFRREIRVAQKASHENLCRVYDLIEHHRETEQGGNEKIACLTMQLLEGKSLLVHLEENGHMPHAQALPLIRQIAAALRTLHSAQIIHRDLKPSNIILCPQPDHGLRAVVTDFGLAKHVDSHDPELFESKPERNAGAPYYMAPELLRGERPTIATDIYAFGLVIDEIVTPSRAYSAQSIEQLFVQKLWSLPALPSQRNPTLPPHWDSVIMRCIDARPEERYQSAEEVVAALEGGLPVVKESPSETSAEPFVPMADPLRRRKIKRRAILAACVGIPVAAGASALAFKSKPLSGSVIVFPIENATGDAEIGWLCKGTGLEVQRRLSQINGLRVIPFYESRAAAPDKLPGEYSLLALMQAHKGHVRLTVQLIRNSTGDLVWIENFERERAQDHLFLQNEIAEGTMRALESNILLTTYESFPRGVGPAMSALRRVFGFQMAAPGEPPTKDAGALECYVRARGLLQEADLDATEKAEQNFMEAVRRDAGFALAYSGLADCQFMYMDYSAKRESELISTARRHAQRGVDLGGNLPETHVTLAAVQQMGWEWENTEFHYAKALSLNPRFARGRRWYAGFLMQFGHFADALTHARQALELDPFDTSTQTSLGLYLFFAGQHDAGAQLLERTLDKKDLKMARHNLGNIYAYLASKSSKPSSSPHLKKAFYQADRVAELERDRQSSEHELPYSVRMYCLYHAVAGNTKAMQPYLDRMLQDLSTGRTSPGLIAQTYAVRGETDSALDLLEQSVDRRDRKIMYLKVHPFYENLKGLPRYEALVARMRL